MTVYKPARGRPLVYILFIALFTNILIGILFLFVNSYTILVLLRVALIMFNAYYLYYIVLNLSLSYSIDDKFVIINSFFGMREIKISIDFLEGYELNKEFISGVKLSGLSNNKFAFGRNIIDRIGTTHMFVTNSKHTIYLKTPRISYAVSPRDFVGFKQCLDEKGIKSSIEEFKINKNIDLYKEWTFLIPFIMVTIVIIILILNPLILYLTHLLPAKMPLNFDATFNAIQYGSGEQFAFKQMTYGVLNMIILLCMYYASYFSAKYDKKSASRYIYIAFIISLTFLMLQIRILLTFK